MSAHTPGPWKVSNKHTVGNDRGELVAETMTAQDARLIAAAPAMLEALEGALQIAMVCEAGNANTLNWPSIVADLGAAIRAAKGETS
jgi:hypothetical protein